MNARRTSHLLITALAVLSLALASCGLERSSADTAATVNFDDGGSVEIPSDELDELYDTLVDDAEFVDAAYGEVGVPPGLRASMLSDMIIGVILEGELDAIDATVSDENASAGTESIEGVVASLFPTADDPMAAAQARFESLPYLPFLADLQAMQFQLGDSLVEASGEAETIEVPSSSHILLATEEEAQEVIALLDDGGDFAELAMEYSTGPTGPDGGDLGCSDPAGFVTEFAEAITDAEIGTIIGPVQTEFGFHVITVTGTEEQTIGAPDPQQLVSNTLLSAISQVTVDVDETIGEWDSAQGRVIPPG